MALFLSRFVNKIDKKGRVSVPASFRNIIMAEGDYAGVVVFPSFTAPAITGCTMSYLENLNNMIEQLDPFSEHREAFELAILASSVNLQFDSDGRILLPEEIREAAELEDKAVFVGRGKKFEIWNENNFAISQQKAREYAMKNRDMLSFVNTNNNGNINN